MGQKRGKGGNNTKAKKGGAGEQIKKVKENPIIIEIKITQANHVQGLFAQ